jgi:hypothetical protein
MREVHIGSPIWDGLRENPIVGIASFRLLNTKGQTHKGNIRVWIDYKETDTKSPLGWKLLYPFPFDMKCSDIVDNYPTQVLNDFRRTLLYLVPLSHMKENKNYRSGSKKGRTMPQSDFRELANRANLSGNESALMSSLAIKKENEMKEKMDNQLIKELKDCATKDCEQ